MLNLPTTRSSYWRDAYPAAAIYPQLAQNLTVDVVIIGAGITGLTSAYLLKQAGLRVVVLDKATVGGGTTGRTTGKVTSQHNLIYSELQQRLGTAAARVYGEANQAAVERVESIVKSIGIDCDWVREDNYVFTTDDSQVATFQKEAQVAASLGLPAAFVTEAPLPFQIKAAVKFSGQAKINAQKYLLGLARAVDGDGSFVFENSSVGRIHDGKPGYVKSNGKTITAAHIIVATNVPTSPLMARGGYCLEEYPRESYIVAGRLPKAIKGMYISPDKQHYSILPVGDSSAERTLLIGGQGHLSGLRGSTTKRYQKLADYAEEHFGVTEITHCWSDRDYLGYDNIPQIGKLYPWSKHLYVGTAFKKWGLSNGTVAAIILTDLITGKQNPWAETFRPNRLKSVASFPHAVIKEITGKA